MDIFSNNPPPGQPAVLWPARIGFGSFLFYLLALFLNLSSATPAAASSRDDEITAVKSQMNDAIFRVQDIVNQPVTRLKHMSNMVDVSVYSPGWFHEGATKPDFNTVDVRTTQQMVYDGHQYVTSDLNPGVVFLGHELEFNPMTKYFITDRSVPKKKLTEAEMLEINRLYRIIGHCEQQLDELQNPEPPAAEIQRLITTHKPLLGVAAALLLVSFYLIRRRRSETSDNE